MVSPTPPSACPPVALRLLVRDGKPTWLCAELRLALLSLARDTMGVCMVPFSTFSLVVAAHTLTKVLPHGALPQ
jgi:hypothetical protein